MASSKVCIVGAGSSGIVAAKILNERGVPFDCIEKGSGIGGLWRYNNDNGVSSAYQSLHINSSRDLMCYSDFPMPSDYPDFPHHSQILRYFESYVEHFGFKNRIRFKTTVQQIKPCNDNSFDVTQQDASGSTATINYGSVIVANGHHWCPRQVDFPGEFTGEIFHSHYYKTPHGLEDKRILVVGIGNSGCDIACETSRISRQTFLSTRRGAHIIPKYIFGKPLDTVSPPYFWTHLPFGMFQRIFAAALYLTRGRLHRYGLPTPKHRILQEHPTVSSDLLNLLGHGKVKIKPKIRELAGNRVRFEDSTEERIDVIIQATGYEIKFPFLDSSLINPTGNDVKLYKRVVHPNLPGLFFVGLVQPWGPLMPLSEAQSEWIADLLEENAMLPDLMTMERAIARERDKMRRRYTKSARHTIQVDFYPYLAELKKERKQGRRLEKNSSRVVSFSPHNDQNGTTAQRQVA